MMTEILRRATLVIAAFAAIATAKASNPRNTLIGAIRWDAWVGPTVSFPSPNNGPHDVGTQVETNLGASQFQFRVPFFGTIIDSSHIQARELTQSIMDQEIAYAKAAGINYWAFDYYYPGSGLDTARNLYLSSTHKTDVSWCVILQNSNTSDSPYFPSLVTEFATSNYQKVMGGRPLVYIFNGGVPYTKAQLDSLRSQTTAAGLPNPYVVAMDGTGAAVGADATSSYVTPGSNGQTYASLASSETSRWNSAIKTVPIVTTGWDPRPRINNPVWWYSYASTSWVQTATPTEIANHLQAALSWTNSFPNAAEANTVIMYAWNEFDEGGWICPTLATGTDRLDAIHAMLAASGGGTLANGTYKIVSRNNVNEAIAPISSGTTNGTHLNQWTYTSGYTAFQWTVTNIGGNNYKVIGVPSGRAMSVDSSSLSDGAQLNIWDYSGVAAQQWTITPTDSGYYTIVSVNSGKAVSVYNSLTTDGVNIIQWGINGSPVAAQQWAFQAP